MPMVDGMYYLKIVGDGFLKYKVRYLMGALLDAIGSGLPYCIDIGTKLRREAIILSHACGNLSNYDDSRWRHRDDNDCHYAGLTPNPAPCVRVLSSRRGFLQSTRPYA